MLKGTVCLYFNLRTLPDTLQSAISWVKALLNDYVRFKVFDWAYILDDNDKFTLPVRDGANSWKATVELLLVPEQGGPEFLLALRMCNVNLDMPLLIGEWIEV